MPIFGLFPTSQEQQYARQVGNIATGRDSSVAYKDIQRNADLARKEAFTQAMQSRGNQALARRQSMDVGRDVTMQAGQQLARQREVDVNAARAEQQRLEQQRIAGINNAIGFAAQGAGMLVGSPAAGGAAQAATSAITGGVQQALQQPQKPASMFSQPQAPQAAPTGGLGSGMTQEEIQSLVGPQQPAAPMREDSQQYLLPEQMDESSLWRQPVSDADIMSLASPLRPPGPLRRDLRPYINPQFLRGVRNYARR